MRCYHLCNFYLAGVHAGIQTAHTQHEMALKYLTNDSPEQGTFEDFAESGYLKWANDHKTLILLNGGMAEDLLEFEAFLNREHHPYAWASFREEVAALNGAITNVGIVLPEKMYNGSRDIGRQYNKEAYGEVFRIGNLRCKLSKMRDPGPDGAVYVVSLEDEYDMFAYRYTQFEMELLCRISRCDLMR